MPGPFARSRVLAPFRMAFKVYPFWRDKSSGARKGFAVRAGLHHRADSARYEGLADYRGR